MRVLACCYSIIIVIVPWWCHLVIAYVIISSCSIVVFVGSLRYIVPFSKLMAQLPSKVPNLAMGTDLPACSATQASWVDEFLDFSAAKRMALRRPVSDSLVLEAPVDGAGGDHEFDHLDDDQLMSMFSDEMPHSPSEAAAISLSNTLRTSDNSKSVEEKIAENEAEEAENICKLEHFEAAHLAAATEQIVDPKRAKRILANRQSAQRSRVRKLQYITELERSVTSLETEVWALSPRVAFLDKQRSLLTLGNRHLEQRIAALAQDKIFKDAHQEALKKEIERLRQVYCQQSLRKKADASSDTTMLTEELLSCNAAADCAPTT